VTPQLPLPLLLALLRCPLPLLLPLALLAHFLGFTVALQGGLLPTLAQPSKSKVLLLLLCLWQRVQRAFCIQGITTTSSSSSSNVVGNVPARKTPVCQPGHQHSSLLLVPGSSRV
jgi:hypothetical protein